MKALKAVVAVVGAAVTAALGLGLDGTVQKVLTIVAAAVTAIGVYAAPNASDEPAAPAKP